MSKTIMMLIITSKLAMAGLNNDSDNYSLQNPLDFHINHANRYEHEFDDRAVGTCGDLFDFAKREFDNNMKAYPELALVDQLLEKESFLPELCNHTTGAFTWVLLVVKDEQKTCEVRVPLNLKSQIENSQHALFAEDQAKMAIDKKETWCYILDVNTGERVEAKIHQEANDEEPIRNEIDHDGNVRDIEEGNGYTININGCTKSDKRQLLSLYAASVIQEEQPGLVVYTENISKCKLEYNSDKTFTAEFSFNDKVCQFNVAVSEDKTKLNLLPGSSESAVLCNDLKGII